MNPNTIAIGNGSAQQDYGNSFDGFLASIQVGAFVAAVQIGGLSSSAGDIAENGEIC